MSGFQCIFWFFRFKNFTNLTNINDYGRYIHYYFSKNWKIMFTNSQRCLWIQKKITNYKKDHKFRKMFVKLEKSSLIWKEFTNKKIHAIIILIKIKILFMNLKNTSQVKKCSHIRKMFMYLKKLANSKKVHDLKGS